MSGKLTTLEDFMKKYISNQKIKNGADSFDTYRHKNGLNYNRSYSRAVESLYADKKRNLATYGQNYRDISNKGLQNSGYAEYVSGKAGSDYTSEISKLGALRDQAESRALASYAGYLEKYSDKQKALKESVTSHLIKNDVVDLDAAVAYAIGQGLTEEDAIAVGQSVYSVTKQKVFNSILEQVATLGLDKNGAVMLAKKMGVTESDAEEFGSEIEEMLKHYKNVSSDYLEYLEQRSDKTTNTFN